jgi:hypothetical protein
MAKIEHLTPEEEALIPIVREEWRQISLATGPADREAAQVAVADAYKQARLEQPKHWIWFDNPWAACIGLWMLNQSPIIKSSVWVELRSKVAAQVCDHVYAQVADQVWDRVWTGVGGRVGHQGEDQIERQLQTPVGPEVWAQVWHRIKADIWPSIPDRLRYEHPWTEVWDQVVRAGYGQHDAGWLSSFDMFRRMKRVKGPERLEPLMRLATVAGWWWPFAGACIMTERPALIQRDEGGRLHCVSGPALAYPDGCAVHVWHGLRIPAWLVEDRARLTPELIEAEANAELRRVMLEMFGFDRYIEARHATLIAEDECLGLPRQLFEIDLEGDIIRVLRVLNGTVEPDGRRRQFHLGVPLECNTPHEAVAWSYGRHARLHSEALRT